MCGFHCIWAWQGNRGLYQVPGAAGECQIQEPEGNHAARSLKVNSFPLQCSISPTERGIRWRGTCAPRGSRVSARLRMRTSCCDALGPACTGAIFSKHTPFSVPCTPTLHRPRQRARMNGSVSSRPSGDSFFPTPCLDL